jgi:hypothetical protein
MRSQEYDNDRVGTNNILVIQFKVNIAEFDTNSVATYELENKIRNIIKTDGYTLGYLFEVSSIKFERGSLEILVVLSAFYVLYDSVSKYKDFKDSAKELHRDLIIATEKISRKIKVNLETYFGVPVDFNIGINPRLFDVSDVNKGINLLEIDRFQEKSIQIVLTLMKVQCVIQFVILCLLILLFFITFHIMHI